MDAKCTHIPIKDCHDFAGLVADNITLSSFVIVMYQRKILGWWQIVFEPDVDCVHGGQVVGLCFFANGRTSLRSVVLWNPDGRPNRPIPMPHNPPHENGQLSTNAALIRHGASGILANTLESNDVLRIAGVPSQKSPRQ